jgi:hypothetical protein
MTSGSLFYVIAATAVPKARRRLNQESDRNMTFTPGQILFPL